MAKVLEKTHSGITTKLLVQGNGLEAAEVVLVQRPDKIIVCFSTQYGCLVGCDFCISGIEKKPKRSLQFEEMHDLIFRALGLVASDNKKKIILSAMGEGEPTLNLQNVISVLSMPDDAFVIPNNSEVKRAISTVAPTLSLMHRLLEQVTVAPNPIKVQFSLHAANPALRSQIIRGSRIDPSMVIELMTKYKHIEYDINMVLIEGINDREKDLTALLRLFDKYGIPPNATIKFNRFNPIKESTFKPSYQANNWTYIIGNKGYRTEVYETDGGDIQAACGQLRQSVV